MVQYWNNFMCLAKDRGWAKDTRKKARRNTGNTIADHGGK